MEEFKKINPFDPKVFPYCYSGHNYALDILSGKINANIWVKGSCKRYLDDLKRIKDDEECPFYFIPEKAEKYLRLVQNFHHVKGKWDTKNIVYLPWQNFAFMNIMGFYSHATNERRYRTAHLDVARGAGKSAMASQAALYFLSLDDPVGNEVYCAASKKEQARLVLDSARAMALKNESYLRKTGVEVRAHSIEHFSSSSFVKALASNADSADGLAAVLIITDELHAMRKSMFDVLDSGQSKRKDSLLLSITTAGTSLEHAGYSQRSYAEKVSLGIVKDETFFALVFRIDETDEEGALDNEDCWIKANPGLYEVNDITNLRAKAAKAKSNPIDRPNFLCKHLNLYQNAMSQFFNIRKWKSCRDSNTSIDDFRGEKCFVGVDVASKIDITSVCYMFKRGELYYPFFLNYVPEDRTRLDACQFYLNYVEEGDLELTPGEVINLPKIEDKIIESKDVYNIADVFCDPWNAMELMTRLATQRLEVTEFRMNTGNLSEPMKKLDEIIRDNKLVHNCGEFMDWVMGNVVARRDHNDNVFPRKENEKNKIDPAVAMMMAISGWIADEQKISTYESGGLRGF